MLREGLDSYFEGFRALGVDSLNDLRLVVEADLDGLGMKVIHKRKYLDAVGSRLGDGSLQELANRLIIDLQEDDPTPADAASRVSDTDTSVSDGPLTITQRELLNRLGIEWGMWGL